jgi:hypothetical protein
VDAHPASLAGSKGARMAHSRSLRSEGWAAEVTAMAHLLVLKNLPPTLSHPGEALGYRYSAVSLEP